jgi:hypothetical protein
MLCARRNRSATSHPAHRDRSPGTRRRRVAEIGCLSVPNADQADTNADGQGDLCEESHERSITLSLRHVRVAGERMLKLSGQLSVADTASRCAQDRRVYLERFNPNTDRRVDVDDTVVRTLDGDYSYKASDVEAKYRASVKDRGVNYHGLKSRCSAASTTTRHRH